jgi:hypothetical protein
MLTEAQLSVISSVSLDGGGRVVDWSSVIRGGRAITDALTSNTIASVIGVNSLLRSNTNWTIYSWLTYVKAKARDVDVAVAPDEESAEDGLGEDVKNAVEDSFRVGGDNIAALGQAPRDGV